MRSSALGWKYCPRADTSPNLLTRTKIRHFPSRYQPNSINAAEAPTTSWPPVRPGRPTHPRANQGNSPDNRAAAVSAVEAVQLVGRDQRRGQIAGLVT